MAGYYADLAAYFSIYAHTSLVNILQVLLINHDLVFIGGNHNVLICDRDNISAYKKELKKNTIKTFGQRKHKRRHMYNC